MSESDVDWMPMPARVKPLVNRAQIIRLPLCVPAPQLESLKCLLNGEEMARAAAFRFESLRTRFIAVHAGLRKILGAYLDTDPAGIRFDSGPQGKPRVASVNAVDLKFNLSHSEDLALVAITRGREIGVDIEKIEADFDYQGVAKYSFSVNEGARLAAETDTEKAHLFYSYWTCKEAYIKARGGGLSIPLTEFEIGDSVAGSPWRAVVERSALEPKWYVYELSPHPAFAGALAVDTKSIGIDLWEWSWSRRSPGTN